jgi:putative ABC transport system permease protein
VFGSVAPMPGRRRVEEVVRRRAAPEHSDLEGLGMESWMMDLRFAGRRLRARPAYTLLAVLTLALGVGGTAAIYGVARTFLLDPLPYRDEGSLAAFWNPGDWSEAEFLYLGQPGFPGFHQVAAYRTTHVTLEAPGGEPRLLPTVSSAAGLLDVLGVRAMLGTTLRPGSDVQGAEPQVVLSHQLWQELGGQPSIVGQRVTLGGTPRTVVGVMPRGFWFPDPTVRAWLSESFTPDNGSGNYALIGRLAPGRTIDGMGASLAHTTTALGERFTYPEQFDKTRNAKLTPIREAMLGPVRPALLATWGALAAILLIACANVAALMLGQVDGQRTELAVRAALGAGTARLAQQMAAEAVALGLMAGVVGALLASAGFVLLRGALPLGALAEGASFDWRVFGVAIALAVFAALAVALVPGLAVLRGDLQRTIARSRTGGVGGRGGRVESTLVVAQVALAMLMAAGAALLVRSVSNLSGIDPGVDRAAVAVVDVATSSTVERPARLQMLRETVAELGSLPGVASAAAVQQLPLRGGGDNWGLRIEGREAPFSTTAFRVVSPDYFSAMGIAVRRGRVFEAADRDRGEPVMVINEALARKYFPGEDPVGRRIASGDGWARVVGVVESVAEGTLTDERGPARYMLYEHVAAQEEYTPVGNTLVVRMQPGRNPAAVLDPARQVVRRVAPAMAIRTTTTMEEVFTQAIGPARQVMLLLALLAALALVLGAVGVFGVVSHFVTRRRRDWGIRMALGLLPSRVVTLVVGRGGALVAGGVALGAVAFILLARWLATFLYGVGTADPLALLGTTLVLLAVGLVAALVPARRASRIDPAAVLRES